MLGKHVKKLDKLGDSVAIVEKVIEEATKFVGACYGSKTQRFGIIYGQKGHPVRK